MEGRPGSARSELRTVLLDATEARRPRAAKVENLNATQGCHLLGLEENSESVGGASQSLVRWY